MMSYYSNTAGGMLLLLVLIFAISSRDNKIMVVSVSAFTLINGLNLRYLILPPLPVLVITSVLSSYIPYTLMRGK